MHWSQRVKQSILRRSASLARSRARKRRDASRRIRTIEELEPRLAMAPVAPGLVEIGVQPTGPLTGKVVFTSGGHGWQWSSGLGRYATDRPEYQLVEDFGNQDQLTYYADYLLRAGATVVPMRPVGRQINEVIVDNDSPGASFSGSWSNSAGPDYYDEDYGAVADAVAYRFASTTSSGETAVATYTPNIPAAGMYPVYTWVARSSNRTNQLYRINHTGGSTEIRVDHSVVGHGWVYLGTYHFNNGSDSDQGSVEISNNGPDGKVVIADAIRFGNGMGDFTDSGAPGPSGYPREDENSYKWIQRMLGVGTTSAEAIGSGTSNVSAPSNMAEWMYQGAFGNAVFVSFHSNGTTGDPATATSRGAVGLITSSGATPHQSDLALFLGRQINQDMQALPGVFEYNWSTRSAHTFTSSFGEIDLGSGAEMDATIIEVAFHDNIQDGALLRDPRVRDQLARSTYQGTLEYFDAWGGLTSPVSVPTAPTNVRAQSDANGEVTISWAAGPNSPAGVHGGAATGFRIYASIDGYGFDGGTAVTGGGTTSATLSGYDPTLPYYFKVVATNAGGESLGSEVVTVLPSGGVKQALIVNGFDRLDRSQDFAYPYAYTGDGLVDRAWSRYNNSFDYVVQVHNAIHAAEPGLHVASTSNEAVISGAVNLGDYDTVIWISGEESVANDTFDATEQAKVEAFIAGGGNLFVTGSEIAWDLDQQNNGRTFYENSLKGNYVADDANTYNVTAAAGGIFAGLPNFGFSNGNAFSSLDGQLYNVDAPDVISPQAGAQLALNYSGGTGGGAAIQVEGTAGRGSVVLFGFPFEAITSADRRRDVMDRVLDFFNVSANMPLLEIETLINGDDADSPPGPTLAAGSSATFAYNVTNTGEVALQNVLVSDDNGTPGNPADDFNATYSGGDTNGNSILDVGEIWTFTALATVGAGQQTHTGTATAEDAEGGVATDAETANYFGSAPGIHVESYVIGDDADAPPGPTLNAGDFTTFAYFVTNDGNVVLSDVSVIDDNGTPDDTGDDISPNFSSGDTNFNNLLDFGESWLFFVQKPVNFGQQVHVATASGQDSLAQLASGSDPTHYFGYAPPSADFNFDGAVNAADYVIWRKYEGTTVPLGTNGDADYDEQVTAADYEVWQAHFGNAFGAGGGATTAAVEETSQPPSTAALSTMNSMAARDAVFAASNGGDVYSRETTRPTGGRANRTLAWGQTEMADLLLTLARHRSQRDAPGQAANACSTQNDDEGVAESVEAGGLNFRALSSGRRW